MAPSLSGSRNVGKLDGGGGGGRRIVSSSASSQRSSRSSARSAASVSSRLPFPGVTVAPRDLARQRALARRTLRPQRTTSPLLPPTTPSSPARQGVLFHVNTHGLRMHVKPDVTSAVRTSLTE